MKLANHTNHFAIFGALALVVATTWVFTRDGVRVKDSSAYAVPSVGLLEVNGGQLMIQAKSNEPDVEEQFVYCVSREQNPSTCSWENYDEFTLSAEGDYYIYVKSLASNKVSEPKLYTYKDTKNVKIKL